MQKRTAFITTLLLSIVVSQLNAQDTIIFKSNQKTAAIIKEIGDVEIRYKDFSKPEGPDFVTNKTNVYQIIFENGEQMQIAKKKQKTGYGRNIMSYHIFDFVYQDFSISYEHILKNGKIGFKVPVAVGFNTDRDNGPRPYNNILYSGLGLNVYIFGQKMASYFMGPEIHVGIGNQEYYYHDQVEPYSSYYKSEEFIYGRFLINNGISFNPVYNFRLAAIIGIGVRYYELKEQDNNDDGFRSTAYFTFSMGFRF